MEAKIFKQGDRFGKLTIVNHSGSYKNKAGKLKGSKFLCKCDCGNIKEYRGTNLSCGVSTSCLKCSKKRKIKFFLKEGDVFGKLIVLSNDFKFKKWGDGTKRPMHLCRCECGSVRYYYKTKLIRGFSKQCVKCSYKKRPQSKVANSPLEILFRASIHQRCKKKEIKHDISINEFEEIISKNCYYCGSEPRKIIFKGKIKDDDNLFANGIDRLNSDKGYIKNNCVPCCKICNVAKSTLTEKEFLNHINKIQNYQNEKRRH